MPKINVVIKWLFFTLPLSLETTGQEAMTFVEADRRGLHTAFLDSSYISAIHADTGLCVFKTNQHEFVGAYRKLLEEFAARLNDGGFEQQGSLKVFNRIYFDSDGTIDYFLYKIRPGQLDERLEQKFAVVLQSFVQSYRFPLTSDRKFSQCGPATYILGRKTQDNQITMDPDSTKSGYKTKKND